VQDAKRLLAAADAAVHRARMTACQPTERVHVACVAGASPGLVSSVLQEFRRQFPTVEIGYCDLSTPAQWEAIAAGTIEIGFARYHPSVKRHVQSEPFIADPLDHVLLPAAHGLAGRDAIALREISGDPMIPHPEACYPVAHGVLMGAFAAVGVEPPLTPERSTFWINATARVAAGEGWMLFPRSLTTLAPQNTRSVRLTDFLVPFGLELIWRRRDDSVPTHNFIAVARDVRDELVHLGQAEPPVLFARPAVRIRTRKAAAPHQRPSRGRHPEAALAP
jgi:DNA-binding transcriptional LysR family regulator